jgi:hypothetical protein
MQSLPRAATGRLGHERTPSGKRLTSSYRLNSDISGVPFRALLNLSALMDRCREGQDAQLSPRMRPFAELRLWINYWFGKKPVGTGDGVRILVITVLAFVTALTGCVSDQERAAQLDGADRDKCISYGANPGTPAYTDCRLKLDGLRARAAAAEASRPLPPPPTQKYCPTAASGTGCIGF